MNDTIKADQAQGQFRKKQALWHWLTRIPGLFDSQAIKITDPVIDQGEQRIIQNVVALQDQRVETIMVPRADIIGLSSAMTIDAMVDRFIDSGHTRLPVYTESLDDIQGMIHLRDLIRYWHTSGHQNLTSVLRQVIFIPPNMSILNLLLGMQKDGVHMALVVDEYGGVDGLLTIEDLLKAVIGEISELRERSIDPEIYQQPDGNLIVDARVSVTELEAHTGLDLLSDGREEHIDTIGGLVFDLADRVPARGETLKHPSGLRFVILGADPRRVHTVRVCLPLHTPASPADPS